MKGEKRVRVRISEVAKMLGVSAQTVRNLERTGKLTSERSAGGQRYYLLPDIQRMAVDLQKLVWAWGSSAQLPQIPNDYYCEQSDRFTNRLAKMGASLVALPGDQAASIASLLTSVAGEIGDNSFAHNLGSWPDVVGIFFAYDFRKRMIALADRGQGVRTTLQRVRPSISSDVEALRIAFTETLSGRSPEKRGNGLKLVKKIAETAPIGLTFNSGAAQVVIPPNGKMDIRTADTNVRGVVAIITF